MKRGTPRRTSLPKLKQAQVEMSAEEKIQFKKDFERGIPVDEVFDSLIKYIHFLFDRKEKGKPTEHFYKIAPKRKEAWPAFYEGLDADDKAFIDFKRDEYKKIKTKRDFEELILDDEDSDTNRSKKLGDLRYFGIFYDELPDK